ncbi:16S rRNA (guanine(966)-N(2))-methyltransferase RsmD [Acidobacteria bacterium AH-259-D05]|nr:16S rRNA (guanine(966)-N(2))-methyltransferase RsmD [Acidobacteria bacterium AH-259-D05]
MRIIGGKYRGRRLAKVQADLRPSSDRLRETLFSIVSDAVKDSVWVEPFAGSGAVGIEALSRGARQLIINDRSSESLQLIRKNLKICQVEKGYQIHQRDVFVFLKKLDVPAIDFLFLDPPYGFGRYQKLLKTVGKLQALQPSTWIIVETFKKMKLEFIPESLDSFRTLRVGNSHLLFLVPHHTKPQRSREES